MTLSRGQHQPRVCVYLVATHLGGGERSVLTLIQAMQAGGGIQVAPMVLVPKSEGPLIDEFKRKGIAFSVLEMPKMFLSLSRNHTLEAVIKGVLGFPALLVYFYRFAVWLRHERIELIYSNGLKCHAISALLGQLLGIPVLWHLRDIISQKLPLSALRLIAKMFRVKLIANSKATASGFDSKSVIPVVYNGLDVNQFFHKPNRDFNLEGSWPESRLVIGIVGALARWKGQMEFIWMAKKLIQQGVDAGFVIVGDEIYDTSGERGFLRELKDEVERLGLSDRVFFSGFREDPAHVMNGLDILVHASTRPEPFGRVVIEAMACGVPVVASAGGGIPEMIRNENLGLTFSPGAVDEMVSQVSHLVSDGLLRRKISREARVEFKNHFTEQHYIAEFSRLFYTQLGQKQTDTLGKFP